MMSRLKQTALQALIVVILTLGLSASSLASAQRGKRRTRARRAKVSRVAKRGSTLKKTATQPREVKGTMVVGNGADAQVNTVPPPEAHPAPKPRGPISGGVLNGRALSLPKPVYPPVARAANATGVVVVNVKIDEEGKVEEAHAVSGHPLLREAAEAAALNARFPPTRLSGQPVKVTGVIAYNFVQ